LKAENKNLENNPMHSSRGLVGIAAFRFYEAHLTRRANHWHDVIMAATRSACRVSKGAQRRVHHLSPELLA
jgi:hypothetical protein